MRAKMTSIKVRLSTKLQKYKLANNQKKVKYYKRQLWAIVGILDQNLDFMPVLDVFRRF